MQKNKEYMSRFDEIEEIDKFNPYHGYHGYFASPNAVGAHASISGKTERGQKLLDHYKQSHSGREEGGTSGGTGSSWLKGSATQNKDVLNLVSAYDSGNTQKVKGIANSIRMKNFWDSEHGQMVDGGIVLMNIIGKLQSHVNHGELPQKTAKEITKIIEEFL